MLGSSLLEALQRTVQVLESSGIDYALVGGLAATVRGRVRSTRDCDVLVTASDTQVDRVKTGFRDLGFSHLDRADRHRLEDVQLLRFWFAVEESGFSLSVDVQVAESQFHREVVTRASVEHFGPVKLRVATREDLILLKLLAWRPIDRADAIDLAALNPAVLEAPHLQDWARRLGLEDRVTELREALE